MKGMAATTARFLPLVLVVAPSWCFSQASFQGVGDIPGGLASSAAYAISGDGTTVVGMGEGPLGPEAFRWRSSTGISGLGDLSGGAWSSAALGVSHDGNAVGGVSESSSGQQAFRWTPTAGMVGLGYMAGRPGRSVVEAVTVVGTNVVTTGAGGTDFLGEAFRQSGATYFALGDLAGGDHFSHAYGLNSNGQVYVGESASSNGIEAFRWQSNLMVGLGDLAGGEFRSQARACSATGMVVVGWGNSALGQEAFRWVSGSGMSGLGDLAGGLYWSEAMAVSADGSVVVGSAHTSAGREAMVWTQAGGMRRLADDLALQGLSLAGWTLVECTGVSADGKSFAGIGVNPQGLKEGWFASAPTPTIVSGTVDFAGLADDSAAPATVTLQLRRAGLLNVFDTRVVAMGPGGTFTVELPRNLIDVSVQTGTWLRRTISVDARPASGVTMTLDLINGDVDGSNRVDLDDFLILAGAYETTTGDPRWDGRADLTRSGMVDLDDFLVLAAAYEVVGDD